MRSFHVRCLLIALCLAPVFAAPPGNASDWDLVFSDDFEGTSVDTTKWNVRTYEDYWGNRLRPSRVKVVDGKVVISCVSGEGGWIDTENKFKMGYGYIEGRTRVSTAANKKKVWPCFWLKRGFPPGEWKPEYDIAEYMSDRYSDGNTVMQASHFATSSGGTCVDSRGSGILKEVWGVFGVLIEKDKNPVYHVNDKAVYTTKCGDPKIPTIAILHALIDGGSAPWPDFECDWVRAYVKKGTTATMHGLSGRDAQPQLRVSRASRGFVLNSETPVTGVVRLYSLSGQARGVHTISHPTTFIPWNGANEPIIVRIDAGGVRCVQRIIPAGGAE